MNNEHQSMRLESHGAVGRNLTGRLAWALGLAVLLSAGRPADAHTCCQCSSNTVSASPSAADLNQPVSINYSATYCRCATGHCGSTGCGLSGSVQIKVFLEGGGQVASFSANLPTTGDGLTGYNTSFSYTPTETGVYTVTTSGPCPGASATFKAGCQKDCEATSLCEECGATSPPTIESNKSDNTIQTACPDCPKEEDKETVTVTANGDADCYELEVTVDDKSVKVESKPADKGSWPGSLSIKLKGEVGTGTATVRVKLFKFDEENQCWMTAEDSLTLNAKPKDDCKNPSGTGGRSCCGRGVGGTINAQKLSTLRMGEIELGVWSGTGDPLRMPRIVNVQANADIEIVLPGEPNARVLEAGSPMRGWVLGGGLRAERIQVSNTMTGLTYRFERTSVGPYPFRLEKVRRFDFTTHSTYAYDGQGELTRVTVGDAGSDDYFEFTRHPDGRLDTIVPYVDGAMDAGRVATLVYDVDSVVGMDGGDCAICEKDPRRYYYSPAGLLTRTTDSSGNDLELIAYDGSGRITQTQRLDDEDMMVVVETREYNLDTTTIHERVSATEERIRVETYDETGRIVQRDEYANLFAHGSMPSGPVLSTTYTYAITQDAESGIDIDTTEVTDPAGVTSVSVLKEFENGAPVFLPVGDADGGWRLPVSDENNAFALNGFQDGDAELSPQYLGATARTTIEVGTAATYHPRTLIHEAASASPGDRIRLRFSLSGGAGGFVDGFFSRVAGDPAPPDPWLAMKLANGSAHPGWDLESGETYTLLVQVLELTSSPNPADGFGIDGISFSRSMMADPAGFATAPYDRIDGPARYLRTYMVGTGGEVSESTLRFERYIDSIGEYLEAYEVDANGGITVSEYDQDGLLVAQSGPEVMLLDGGGTARWEKTFEYDVNRNLVRVSETASGGGMVDTTYEYDAYGRVTRIVENADGAPAEQAEELRGYNIYSETKTVTDACGNVTERFHDSAGRLVDEVVYASGASGPVLKQTHYDYDAQNRVTRRRVAANDGPFNKDAPAAWADTITVFDLSARVLSESQPGPNGGTLAVTFDYDYQGQAIEQVDAVGRIERRQYDGAARIVRRSMEAGALGPYVTSNGYNAAGQLVSMTTPDTGTTTFAYDGLGRRTAEVHAARKEWTYDAAGRVRRELVTEVGSGIPLADMTVDYDAMGRVIRTRNRLATGVDGDSDPLMLMVYDAAGKERARIWKAEGNLDASNAEAGDRVESFTYDALGRRVSQVNSEGERVDFGYDACGRVISETVDPLGLNIVVAFDYDAANRRTKVTDPLGHYVVTEYDSLDLDYRETSFNSNGTIIARTLTDYDTGRRTLRDARLADPTRTTIDFSADAIEEHDYATTTGLRERVSRYVGGVARSLEFEYDAMGRRTLVRMPANPMQNYTQVVYDAATCRIASAIRSNESWQRQTDYAYDAFGRRTRSTDIATGGDPNRVLTMTYDGLGRGVSSIGWDGKQMTRSYDLVGRLVGMVDDAANLQQTQAYEYDRLGSMTRQVVPDSDGPDQVTLQTYDTMGRPTGIIASDGATATYSYDSAGRITAESDPRGFTVDYGLDARGLLISRVVDDPGFEDFWVSETLAYDALGSLTLAERGPGSRTVTQFNALRQVTQQRQTVDGVEKTIDYGRSQLGQRESITVPGGETISYVDDALGRNTEIRRDGNALVQYDYAGVFPKSRRLITGSGTDVVTQWDYNVFAEALAMNNVTTNGSSQNILSFAYDRLLDGSPDGETMTSDVTTNGYQIDFQYDTLRRLTKADYVSGSRTGAEDFGLDILGNRDTYWDRGSIMGVDPGAAYQHDLANAYTAIGGSTPTYDAAGNMTVDEDGYQYDYDFANRIVEVRDSGGAVLANYEYNALGQRIVAEIAGQRTRYYYDDNGIVLAEFDGSDTRLRYYVDGTTYLDEHAVVHDDATGQDYFYAVQNNFTVAGLLDQNGNLVEQYLYDAYGKVDSASGSPPVSTVQRYFYNGRRMDFLDGGALQLQWNRNRYYWPEHGRWTARDPLGLDVAPNLYEYVLSNPAKYVDPFGRNEVTVNTPWGDVSVGEGCVGYSKDFADKDWKKHLLGGKLVLSAGVKGNVSFKVCRKCCKAGTAKEGETVFEISAELSFSGEGGAEFRPWGFHYRLSVTEYTRDVWIIGGLMRVVERWVFRGFEVDGWLGLTFGGKLGGEAKGTLKTDLCNNKLLTGDFCITLKGSGTVSGGGSLSVEELDVDDPWKFSVTAAIRGQISGSIENCYQCKNDSCGWSGWKNPCVKGKVWVEFKVLKWGVSVDLIKGDILGCKG